MICPQKQVGNKKDVCFVYWLCFWIGISLISIGLGVYFGSTSLSLSELLSPEYKQIFLEIRLPRVLLAFLLGASLSLAGGGYQGVLRNTLAEPYLLGVSSGCAMGAILAILLGFHTLIGIWSLPVFAFIGGITTLSLVFYLVHRSSQNREHSSDWILAGVLINAILGAVISILLIVYDEHQSEILYWLMGSLSLKTWSSVWVLLPYLCVSAFLLLKWSPGLDVLSLGKRQAWHAGVPVNTLQWKVLIVSSILAAACVSVSGVVGFVGLIVPHLVRLMVGPNYRKVFALSCLVGGVLVVGGDALARLVLAPEELPLGGITAFVGGPFFLLLWVRQRRQSR
jgi:iron complex transport system permease protein